MPRNYLGPREVSIGGTIPVEVIFDTLVEHSLGLAATKVWMDIGIA